MRIWKAAGISVVALGALTACGGVQGAGLFVDGERISEEVIDGYVDDQVDSYLEQGATEADIDFGSDRESVVLCVLFAELGRASDTESVEASDNLESECTGAQAYIESVYQSAEPRELTDEELEHVQGLGGAFEQLPPDAQAELMLTAGFHDALIAQLEEYDVRVNPRYGVETFSLLNEQADGLFDVEIPQR